MRAQISPCCIEDQAIDRFTEVWREEVGAKDKSYTQERHHGIDTFGYDKRSRLRVVEAAYCHAGV